MKEISKVTISDEKLNHRQRRAQAKRLIGSVCNRHNEKLALRGTQLVCLECIRQYRKANGR